MNLAGINAVDFVDLCSPGVFKAQASAFGLTPGGVYDLRFDWNLSSKAQRARCRKEIKAIDPTLVIGSALCAPFSQLQALSPDTPEARRLRAEATDHPRFCFEMYE